MNNSSSIIFSFSLMTLLVSEHKLWGSAMILKDFGVIFLGFPLITWLHLFEEIIYISNNSTAIKHNDHTPIRMAERKNSNTKCWQEC